MASTTTPTPKVYINPQGKKTFVPLENNPAVFTDLVHRLGVSPELGFYDIYSIDDPGLLSLVPRPVHAIIFISPPDVYYRVREHDAGSPDLTYTGSGPDEPIIWFRQTIGHACGLIALLHSVSNGPARQFVQPDSLLDNLLRATVPLKPLPRAQVLYDSAALEAAHMAAAVTGDTAPPNPAEPAAYHFISFVKGTDGHVYELEGGWGGPIDRGDLAGEEDMLGEKAIEMCIRRYLRAADGNLEFSMVALATRPSED